MLIERVQEPGKEWDAFAESHPDVRVGHAAAWSQILRDAYGLTSDYLAVRNSSGEISGILPLVRFRTLSRKRELISLPYLDSAGILARDADSHQSLREAALEIAQREGCGALELRQPGVGDPDDDSTRVDRVNLAMPLASDVDAQWKALRAKVRNQTRKAEKEGLELADGDTGTLFDAFYGPFQINMRDLGSPVHSAAFFEAAARHFGDRLRFVVTRLGDLPVGGLVAIRYGNAVTVPWASTLRAERRRCPNNQIYWEALRWAIEQGANRFDFGRSPRESGTHRFKVGWGAVEEPLAWERVTATGEPIPMTVGNQSALLEGVSKLWTRLPIPVAGLLGPRLRRFFSN